MNSARGTTKHTSLQKLKGNQSARLRHQTSAEINFFTGEDTSEETSLQMQASLLKLHGMENKVIHLKNEYRKKISQETNQVVREPLAMEKMKLDFIDVKKHSSVFKSNILARFLSKFIY